MFRILHLSDLHARESTDWSTTPILSKAKNTILEHASTENIDLVVFTGDIAYSGKKAEYDIAEKWLDDLCLGSSGLNLQKGQILAVPGNHDADRSMIKPGARAIEEELSADYVGAMQSLNRCLQWLKHALLSNECHHHVVCVNRYQ